MPNLSLFLICLVGVLVPGGEGAEVADETSKVGTEDGLWDRLLDSKRLITHGMPVEDFRRLFNEIHKAIVSEQYKVDQDQPEDQHPVHDAISHFANLRQVGELTEEQATTARQLVGRYPQHLKKRILQDEFAAQRWTVDYFNEAFSIQKKFFGWLPKNSATDVEMPLNDKSKHEKFQTLALRFLDVLTDDHAIAAYYEEGPDPVSTLMHIIDLRNRFKKATEYVRDNTKAYKKRYIWKKGEPSWRALAGNLLDPPKLYQLILSAKREKDNRGGKKDR
eukprot:GHVU01078054.1.p1 GENE.GHVU01078054.1~~GHVU01078054.1.p1  ORF type:complete len:277 (-),score=22.59 GHVU01078054.1:170-1000(-)